AYSLLNALRRLRRVRGVATFLISSGGGALQSLPGIALQARGCTRAACDLHAEGRDEGRAARESEAGQSAAGVRFRSVGREGLRERVTHASPIVAREPEQKPITAVRLAEAGPGRKEEKRRWQLNHPRTICARTGLKDRTQTAGGKEG